MGIDADSLRILLAATRANQKYADKDKNEASIREDSSVMDSMIGRRLLQEAARANNQYSARNWSEHSRGNWSPRKSPRGSPRSPRSSPRSPRTHFPRSPRSRFSPRGTPKRSFAGIVDMSGRPKGTF